MARGYGGAVMKVFGAKELTLTVVEIVDVTTHFRRITFDAPGFFDGKTVAPADFVRLWAPDPDKPGREHQRGYTLVDPDPEAGRFSLEFLIHEPAGPASAWARDARIGDTIPISSWSDKPHFTTTDPAPDGYLLIGDVASLPGINAILAEVPDEVPVEILLEQHDERDRRVPITAHPKRRVGWVRAGDAAALAGAIDDRDWSNWYAWVTGEAATAKQVRNRLRDLGFPKPDVHGRAYWKRGRAMGVDRDDTATEADPVVEVAEPVGASEPAPETAADRRSATSGAGWRSQAGSRLLRPLRGRLILAGVFQVVASLSTLAPFVLLVELCRRLLDGDTRLWGLGVTALVLMGAGVTVSGVLVLAMHVVDARFGHDVRVRVVGKLGRLPLGWFTDRSSGRVKKAVQDDTGDLHYLVTHAVLDVVAAIVTPLAVLAYLFTVSVRLTLVLLVPLLVYVILTGRMVQASAAQLTRFQSWEERVATEAVGYLDGLVVARAYDAGPSGGFHATLAERARFLDAWQRPMSGRKTLVDLVTRPTTSLLVILVAGGLFVSGGALTAVDLLPFLILGVTFGGQLLAIAFGMGAVREATAAARRIGLLLDETELSQPEEPARLDGSRHTLRFEKVGFGYEPGHPVLTDVDLELKPGTLTALVGPSGSGKSTVAALAARFHDPDTGRISVDGVDLRELPLADLYRTVGFVFQDARLVDGTVAENIALSTPDADRSAVEAAARAAGIHERITRLPRGYDTVSPRLSGGEAQRLTIARALLADPPVLILDEATAFADPESEHQVQQALSRLIAGRTVLVIAHRLHTVTGADSIVVLDGGRVAQRGTHSLLLSQPGLYRELWQATTVAEART